MKNDTDGKAAGGLAAWGLSAFVELGPCAFCGQVVAAHPDGIVLHELPVCARFELLDPDSFVQQMLAKRSGKLAQA